VVGVAALVATLGLSKTAGNQIVGRFDALAATDIVVTPKTGRTGRAVRQNVLPWDAEQRVGRLNGVVAAGTLTDVNVRGELVRAVPVNDPQGQTQFQVPVKAASPGLFRAVRARLSTGRLPDAGHSARGDRVVVLGPNVAAQLHVTRVDNQPAIYIGDRLYVVVGLLSTVQRQPSLLGGAALGLVGGVVGAAVGTLVVVGVAASRAWTPVLEAWVPLGAPLLGGAVGLLSGLYPSARAAALEPVEALRSTM